MKRVVIIGLGGIGSNLTEPLCRTLAYSDKEDSPKRVILIDGKAYKERNRGRQRFSVLANKADVQRDLLTPLFPELKIESKASFVDENNILVFIKEDDVVFLGCDNHATRKLVSYHASSLDNVIIISGGNELYDGNVQIYLRADGKDITPPLTFQHPEIENPADRNPSQLSCEELAKAGEPQLLTVNSTVAVLMLNIFTLYLLKGSVPYYEIYFDINTGNVRPVRTRA